MKQKTANYQYTHHLEHDGYSYTIEFNSYDEPEKTENSPELNSEIVVRKEGKMIFNAWPPQYDRFNDKIKDELLADILGQWDVILTNYDK